MTHHNQTKVLTTWFLKGVGAPSAHYVTDKEWNYSMLCMYMNMEEVEP
jgi:hypothetical protein